MLRIEEFASFSKTEDDPFLGRNIGNNMLELSSAEVLSNVTRSLRSLFVLRIFIGLLVPPPAPPPPPSAACCAASFFLLSLIRFC